MTCGFESHPGYDSGMDMLPVLIAVPILSVLGFTGWLLWSVRRRHLE